MRLDIHTHLVGISGDHGIHLGMNPRWSPTYQFFKWMNGMARDPWDASLDGKLATKFASLVESSDAIDAAVAFAMDGVYDWDTGALDRTRTPFLLPNEYLFEVCAMHPQLLPGCSINPYREDALEELDRCAQRGTVLVKWVPNTQNIDPADTRLVPFYRRMAEHGLPLLSHTGYEHAMKTINQALGDPKRLALPLDEGLTVIAGHAGASGTGWGDKIEYFHDYLAMLERYPNLYGDISAFTVPNRKKYLLEFLEMNKYWDRLVHGSDYPVPPMSFLFWRRIKFGELRRIGREKNPFSKDVLIKRELGVPDDVFHRGADLIRRPVA